MVGQITLVWNKVSAPTVGHAKVAPTRSLHCGRARSRLYARNGVTRKALHSHPNIATTGVATDGAIPECLRETVARR